MSEPGAFGLQWGEAEIGPGWQGIAALSFSEPPPPGFAVALSVRLAKPAAGLAPQDIAVTAPGGLPLEAEVMPVADGDGTITVRFVQQGPRGRTLVRLLSGGDDPLDPFFAEAGFDFFVACPAGDCREPAAPPPPPGVQPAIDLATKDFTGFLAVMQNWAAATDPNWAGTNPASTEAMLVELLAHHAEMLSLHQDRVAQEAFVDTARERLSLSRHAAALGLTLDEGGSALAVVAVDLPPGRAGFLPAGTRFVREEGMGRITATFTSRAPAMLDAAWNAGLQRDADRGLLRPAAWPGAPDAILPAGARELLLWGWGAHLLPGQRIALVQGRAAHVTRIAALAEISQPGWAADPSDPAHTLPRELTRLELAEPLPLPVAVAPIGADIDQRHRKLVAQHHGGGGQVAVALADPRVVQRDAHPVHGFVDLGVLHGDQRRSRRTVAAVPGYVRNPVGETVRHAFDEGIPHARPLVGPEQGPTSRLFPQRVDHRPFADAREVDGDFDVV